MFLPFLASKGCSRSLAPGSFAVPLKPTTGVESLRTASLLPSFLSPSSMCKFFCECIGFLWLI